jgi:hypothetical protein
MGEESTTDENGSVGIDCEHRALGTCTGVSCAVYPGAINAEEATTGGGDKKRH